MSITPIITSLLDTDAYKMHMQQAVLHQNPHVNASYEFVCRNSDDYLGMYTEEIKEQIQLMANIRLTDDEYDYLLTIPHFKKDYLSYLSTYCFKPEQVTIHSIPAVLPNESSHNTFNEGHSYLVLTIDGPWVETILWEVPLLAIISEVVQRHRHPEISVEDALNALHTKLDVFFSKHNAQELRTFSFTDFGTRRRFSRRVQEEVVRALQMDTRFKSYLKGTSNYNLARQLNLPPIGTQAHEWFQAFQQLSPQLRQSQSMALHMWLKEYPHTLGIALTDCITMDAFLNDFTPELARAYSGLRHDSGDPVEWGKKAIAHYRKLNIDPHTKVLVFSDGLSLERAVELYNTFKHDITVMCGVGTSMTCSLEHVRPMNIVIKMVRCQGRPVAKLSDSPGKSITGDSNFIKELIHVFNLKIKVERGVTQHANTQINTKEN